MKYKLFNIVLVAITLLVTNSCDEHIAPGEGIQRIDLEVAELTVSEKENTLTVEANKPYFAIASVHVYENDKETIYFNELIWYPEDANGNKILGYKNSITGECFSVTQNYNRLEIVLNENNSGKKRSILIRLAGDVGYSAGELTILQEALLSEAEI